MQLKCYVMKWKEILWYKDSNETPLVGILCDTKMVFSFLVKLIYRKCLRARNKILSFLKLFSQLSCIPFSRQSYLLFINGTKSACFASVGKFFSRLYCLLAFVLVGKACNSLKKRERQKCFWLSQLFLFSWRKHWTLIHPFSILLKVYFTLSF